MVRLFKLKIIFSVALGIGKGCVGCEWKGKFYLVELFWFTEMVVCRDCVKLDSVLIDEIERQFMQEG